MGGDDEDAAGAWGKGKAVKRMNQHVEITTFQAHVSRV